MNSWVHFRGAPGALPTSTGAQPRSGSLSQHLHLTILGRLSLCRVWREPGGPRALRALMGEPVTVVACDRYRRINSPALLS